MFSVIVWFVVSPQRSIAIRVLFFTGNFHCTPNTHDVMTTITERVDTWQYVRTLTVTKWNSINTIVVCARQEVCTYPARNVSFCTRNGLAKRSRFIKLEPFLLLRSRFRSSSRYSCWPCPSACFSRQSSRIPNRSSSSAWCSFCQRSSYMYRSCTWRWDCQ